MGTGDSRIKPASGLGLVKGTYQNPPPVGTSYIIKDSDGSLKEFREDGSKVPLGLAGAFNNFPLYVHPNGSNANDGRTTITPLKTLIRALDLVPNGGHITVADGCQVSDGTEGGGVVAGQGLWLCGPRYQFVPPGFRLVKPCVIEGVPTKQVGFSETGVASLNISHSPDRFNPKLWLTGCGSALRIRNLDFYNSQDSKQPAIIGVDYPRKAGGSINFLNIATASRAGGATTLTFAALYSAPVTTAQNTAGNATFNVTLPAGVNGPGVPNPTLILSGSPDTAEFPNGNYVFIAGGAALPSYQFLATARGIDTVLTTMTGATLSWHGVQAGDYVEIVSTNPEWPSTQYRVLSVTATTITVFDPYGSAPGHTATVSANNIGQLAPEDRSLGTADTFVTVDNCQFIIANPANDFGYGPTVNLGGCAAGGWQYIHKCQIQGNLQNNDVDYDEDRAAAILMSAGSTDITGGIVEGNNYFNGHLLIRGPRGGGYVSQVQQEVQVAGTKPGRAYFPTVHVIGDHAFDLDNIAVNDTASVLAIVKCEGTSRDRVRVSNVLGLVEGPCLRLLGGTWTGQGNGMPVLDQVGFYDRFVSGYSKSALMTGGVYNPLYTNIAKAPSAYAVVNNATILTGQTGRWGGPSAVRVTGTGASPSVSMYDANPGSLHVGDYVIACCWVKRVGGALGIFQGGTLINFSPSTTSFTNTGATQLLIPPVGTGSDWAFALCWDTIGTVQNTTDHLQAALTLSGNGDVVTVDLFTLIYLPYTTDPNVVGDLVQSLQPYATTATPGILTTPPGVKLVGHGGLGTAKHYVVGVASGQITLTGANGKAVELCDEAGNSLGVVTGLQGFTVNP